MKSHKKNSEILPGSRLKALGRTDIEKTPLGTFFKFKSNRLLSER